MTTSTLDAPPSQKRGGMSVSSFYDSVFRFFCSLRLTVVTIFLLMVGSFTGMCVDQTQSYEAPAKVEESAAFGAQLLEMLRSRQGGR